MDLPIKFPSDADVIVEETNRFRALSPAARMKSIRDLISAGIAIIGRSPHRAFMQDYTRDQERISQENVRSFYERHG